MSSCDRRTASVNWSVQPAYRHPVTTRCCLKQYRYPAQSSSPVSRNQHRKTHGRFHAIEQHKALIRGSEADMHLLRFICGQIKVRSSLQAMHAFPGSGGISGPEQFSIGIHHPEYLTLIRQRHTFCVGWHCLFLPGSSTGFQPIQGYSITHINSAISATRN